LAADQVDVRLFQLNVDIVPFWTDPDPETLLPTAERSMESITICEKSLFRETRLTDLHRILTPSDQKSFIAVDGSSAKLWDIESPKNKPFSLLDLQQKDELTAGDLMPTSTSLILFGLGSGGMQLFDMSSGSVVSEFDTARFAGGANMDPAVTYVQFDPSGTMFASRTFSLLYVWDVRSTGTPLSKQEVQSHPERADYDRKSDDTKHDTFGSLFTKNGEIFSGLFGQWFVSWDWRKSVLMKHKATRGGVRRNENGRIDFTKRVSKMVANHSYSVLGVASTNALFFYQLE
jgi:WD40 repeat protein